MIKNKAEAQELSRQVDALLAGKAPESAEPLLATARILAEASPAAPSPVFTQQLRRRLLQAETSPATVRQERSIPMWKRFAAVGMTALLIIALVWVALPRSLSAQQVLARAAKSTAVEPGQIVYQVYSSQGALYREWQRLEAAPDGGLTPVETMTIRYAKDDTAFKTPLEWVYSAPTRFCRLPGTSGSASEVDIEGCQSVTPAPETGSDAPSGSSEPGYSEAIDPAVRQQIQETLREAPDAPGAPDMALVESIQGQIERLQTGSDNVSVVRLQLEARPVYAITSGQGAPQPDEDAFTRTLYVDQDTFLPAGFSYTLKGSSGEDVTWSALVLEYRVLDPAVLDFDPFAWPPAKLP